MATIKELLGFDEVYYLLDAYTESSETDETYGETVGDILKSFPGEIITALPCFAKESFFSALEDLGRRENFGDYFVSGKLYVYQESKGYPINRISFDTHICKIPPKNEGAKKIIETPESLTFHVTVRGEDLSKELGTAQYLPGCSAKIWQLNMPKEKVFEPIVFRDGILRLENLL